MHRFHVVRPHILPPLVSRSNPQYLALHIRPRELKAHSADATRIEVRLSKPEADGALKNLEGVTDAREISGTYVLHSKRPPQTIVSLVKHLEAEGNELVSMEIATPSLEDVFIEMTGRRLRD